MGKHWNEDNLDAYGHLTWTAGNEDWIACLDAVLSPDRRHVRWHVVVDCESGGFTDTIESGEVEIDRAEARLAGMIDYWAGVCAEHYADEPEDDESTRIDWDEVRETEARWAAHIASLVAEARRLGPTEDEGDEPEDGWDPVRDGWVGRDGLP